MIARHLFAGLSLLAATILPVRAQSAEEWIAKARSYLGGEKALSAVRSIHFTGTLETSERVPSETDKNTMVSRPVSVPVDIVFEKPFRQKVTIMGPKVVESTALDGYDAWQKLSNPANPAQWELKLLGAGQVRRLRANTLENLAFYSTREMPGCVVQVGGNVQVDGVACVKLVFTHAGGVVFKRYFEQATGRLIKTDTENGTEIREEGEMVVAGIRFPKRVVNKAADGALTTISFDKIVINEVFPADTFTVPSLRTR
jgi:hypothetical protein